jgi:hypothetical protein
MPGVSRTELGVVLIYLDDFCGRYALLLGLEPGGLIADGYSSYHVLESMRE